jgi:peroxiredoxin
MKRTITAVALLALIMSCREAVSASASAPASTAAVGAAAPAFSSVDTYGKSHSLQQYKGKWVVLEWLNHDCPYVRKHYSGAMQALQKKWTGKGVVWLSVVSSAPGKQGHFTNAEANERTKEKGASPTAVLVDESGTVGRLYGARTTPHMFVIDPQGKIVYMGGIDDKPTSRVSDLEGANPLVDAALTQATAGKPVAIASSQPYGCSVKY